jgi:UDP-N-acetylmuramoylalanine--D-glutamate ligase
MIAATQFEGQKIALFGLGGSGLSAARSLVAGGAILSAFDDNPERCTAATDAGIPVADLHDADWAGFTALVLSPGVPLTHPAPHWSVTSAQRAGVPIIGDIEIFERERAIQAPNSHLIAITGTNGKSTTTALIAHLLQTLGSKAEMGGNIGRAVLDIGDLDNETVYVLELSSYQIELTPGIRPDVGILLNLSPDHLDRHGDMDRYAGIKAQLVDIAARQGSAVIGIDDKWCADIRTRLQDTGGSVQAVSVEHEVDTGAFARNGQIFLADGGQSELAADIREVETLKGAHNWQNAGAALLALRAIGYSTDKITAAFASFPGLAHRMELVATRENVRFVNDSKATNAEAAARALESYTDIFWIAGGRGKSGGIDTLEPLFGRIRHAFLIGEAAENFRKTLSGKVSFTLSGDLDRAVRDAARAARDFVRKNSNARPVVLLAPAAASFDQFVNFEVRGNAFREAVKQIAGGDTKDRV